MKERAHFTFYASLRNYPGEMLENMNEVIENAEARANKISKSIADA
jgi:hypothetical protein